MKYNSQILLIGLIGAFLSAIFIIGLIHGLSPQIFLLNAAAAIVFIFSISLIRKDLRLALFGLGAIIFGVVFAAQEDLTLLTEGWGNAQLFLEEPNESIARYSIAVMSAIPWFTIAAILLTPKTVSSE